MPLSFHGCFLRVSDEELQQGGSLPYRPTVRRRSDGGAGRIGKSPMTPDEMDWMRRVGKAKYQKPSLFSIKG
jgi:hypothetical protein